MTAAQECQLNCGSNHPAVESAHWTKFLESRKPIPLDALPLLAPDCRAAPNDKMPRSLSKAPMLAAAEAALAFPWRGGTHSLLYGCQRVHTLAPGEAGVQSRPPLALAGGASSAQFSQAPPSRALRACGLQEVTVPSLKKLSRPSSLPSLWPPIDKECPVDGTTATGRKLLSPSRNFTACAKQVEKQRAVTRQLTSANMKRTRVDMAAGSPHAIHRHRLGGA